MIKGLKPLNYCLHAQYTSRLASILSSTKCKEGSGEVTAVQVCQDDPSYHSSSYECHCEAIVLAVCLSHPYISHNHRVLSTVAASEDVVFPSSLYSRLCYFTMYKLQYVLHKNVQLSNEVTLQ